VERNDKQKVMEKEEVAEKQKMVEVEGKVVKGEGNE